MLKLLVVLKWLVVKLLVLVTVLVVFTAFPNFLQSTISDDVLNIWSHERRMRSLSLSTIAWWLGVFKYSSDRMPNILIFSFRVDHFKSETSIYMKFLNCIYLRFFLTQVSRCPTNCEATSSECIRALLCHESWGTLLFCVETLASAANCSWAHELDTDPYEIKVFLLYLINKRKFISNKSSVYICVKWDGIFE